MNFQLRALPAEQFHHLSGRTDEDLAALGASPYRSTGPIFVREGAPTAQPGPNEIPPMFGRRLLSVRGYDDAGLLVLTRSGLKWSFTKRFDSSEECLNHLEAKNFVSIVTSPHIKGARNVVLNEADYTVYAKLAVWFGNESLGISDVAVSRSEMCVSIPMFGMIESLNLGTTSGIVLYEITRQRREYQRKYTWRNRRGLKDDA